MKYDFTTLMDRRGKDAIAVDLYDPKDVKHGLDVIPMWVADMNFSTLPDISEAMIERAKHPAFGYFQPRPEYYDHIINWHQERYGTEGLKKEDILYANGVLGGVVSALNVLCQAGDNVLLQSPTYIGFTGSLENNGWNIVLNPMVEDENGVMRIDYEDMEKKIVDNKIHAAVFCSPHNPTGRVWERWEIEKAMEIYAKHDVYVVSDEIWADLIMPGHKHIPTQSVSEDARNRVIAMYAPSKTFNLAGLIGSYQIVYNSYLRDRIEKQASLSHYNSMNVLSMHACIAAYTPNGMQWVDELCSVLNDNITYACNFIKEHFEGVKVHQPEGTYMLFLDCTEWCEKHHVDIETLQNMGKEVGVIWQDGRPFHGPCHIRMNLASPHSRVVEAFNRLDTYVFNAK